MNSIWLSLPFVTVLAVVSMLVVLSLSPSASAIPAFSRRYGTSFTTCQSDFPKLNDFGKAFKDAGFKFPKDDESFLKTHSATRNRFTPCEQFLIHANMKTSNEYQIMPKQIVYNPAKGTGSPDRSGPTR